MNVKCYNILHSRGKERSVLRNRKEVPDQPAARDRVVAGREAAALLRLFNSSKRYKGTDDTHQKVGQGYHSRGTEIMNFNVIKVQVFHLAIM